MPIVPMPSQPGDNFGVGLTRFETRRDGSRYWPEVFTAVRPGFRPLAASVRVPPPAGQQPPLVICIHGGGWLAGHRNVTNPSLAAMHIADTLLAAGYATASISYRLSAEAQFPAQLQDCRAAVRYLRRHAATFGFDADRIAVLGESAGGHLALLLGQRIPEAIDEPATDPAVSADIDAVIAFYPVANFQTLGATPSPNARFSHNDPASPASRLLGATVTAAPDLARAASPVAYVSAASAPTLLVHGTADTVVPHAQSVEMQAALSDAGVDADLVSIEGAQHCFYNAETTPIMPRCIQFLDRVFSR